MNPEVVLSLDEAVEEGEAAAEAVAGGLREHANGLQADLARAAARLEAAIGDVAVAEKATASAEAGTQREAMAAAAARVLHRHDDPSDPPQSPENRDDT